MSPLKQVVIFLYIFLTTCSIAPCFDRGLLIVGTESRNRNTAPSGEVPIDNYQREGTTIAVEDG